MIDEVTINVGKQFSQYPVGRLRQDGSGSGEEFRDRLLIPLLEKKHSKINVELDDAIGYGSSFLEEAFGGLVRKGYVVKDLLKIFNFISEDLSLVHEITAYISEAR